MPERVRPSAVADMTGLSIRKVQQMAIRGEIPSAAKFGGIWTFNPAAVRAWIREKEAETTRRAQAAASVGANLTWRRRDRRIAPDETINARYEEIMRGGRKAPAKRPKR